MTQPSILAAETGSWFRPFVVCLAWAAGATAADGEAATVSLEVINESSTSVQRVNVHYDSCGDRGVINGAPLPPGQATRIRLSICGEGSYFTEVEFADGRRISGSENYIEAGDRPTDLVTENAVRSTSDR